MNRPAVLAIFLFSFLAIAQSVYATFSVVSGTTCSDPDNTAIFSLWARNNSHAGAPTYFSNFTLCTNEVTSAAIRSSCLAGEKEILSFFKTNDTHVSKAGVYGQKVCVSPGNYTCAVKNSCLAGQSCLGSVTSESNSNFAECNFYSKQICCGSDTTGPTITNASINATSIEPADTVRFTVNVTDDFEVSTVIATISQPSGTLQNQTMSILSGDLYFLDYDDTADLGVYTWTTVYANDTQNTFSTASPNLEFTVRGVAYKLTGVVLDALTGLPIESGTAVAVIKETGDRSTGTVSAGVFTIDISTTVAANASRFTVGVSASGGGKFGYKQLILGEGPFVEQTQACTNRNIGFRGFAVDPVTGKTLQTGTATATITTETDVVRNSTNFSTGEWSVNVTTCVIPGAMYPVDLIVDAEGRRIQNAINYVPT